MTTNSATRYQRFRSALMYSRRSIGPSPPTISRPSPGAAGRAADTRVPVRTDLGEVRGRCGGVDRPITHLSETTPTGSEGGRRLLRVEPDEPRRGTVAAGS